MENLLENFLQTGLLKMLPEGIALFLMFYLLCKAVDFSTGLLKTWKNPGTYKSRIMRDGLIRWIAELLAIFFVICLDIVLGLNFLIVTATLALFVYKEAGSIRENFKECGVTLPDVFDKTIEGINPGSKETKSAAEVTVKDEAIVAKVSDGEKQSVASLEKDKIEFKINQ